jgi:hypothetical protein
MTHNPRPFPFGPPLPGASAAPTRSTAPLDDDEETRETEPSPAPAFAQEASPDEDDDPTLLAPRRLTEPLIASPRKTVLPFRPVSADRPTYTTRTTEPLPVALPPPDAPVTSPRRTARVLFAALALLLNLISWAAFWFRSTPAATPGAPAPSVSIVASAPAGSGVASSPPPLTVIPTASAAAPSTPSSPVLPARHAPPTSGALDRGPLHRTRGDVVDPWAEGAR